MDILLVCYNFILIMIVGSVILLLTKLYISFRYFSNKNIPYEQPKTPFGSISLLESLSYVIWDLYKRGEKHRIFGYYILWNPAILVRDPELIKDILVKHNSNFYNRGLFIDEKLDPISGNLFALEDNHWKNLRTKLSPAFTSGKMKLMFPTVVKFAEKLVSHINNNSGKDSLECYNLTAKYTLSNIASTAFGLESGTFEEESKFMEMAVKINDPNFFNLLRTFLVFELKGLVSLFGLKLRPEEITLFYLNLVKDTVLFREEQNVVRDDFLQLLMTLAQRKSTSDSSADNSFTLSTNQITAQAFVFILAGFETSALQESWALYEIALNPDIQRRLQAEVDGLKEWTYDSIMGLSYLESVLKETLRKYPVAPFLIRKCSADFPVPCSDMVIEAGSMVYISLLGLHRDPNWFPEPDKFDPERFGPNPPHEIKPYSYLPFGEGPRYCIGKKFGEMQSKVGIATLMRHFTVEPVEKTQVLAQLIMRAVLY